VPLARIASPACRQASAVHLPRVAQWDLPATRHDAELQAAIEQEQADTETLQVSAWQGIQAAADDAATHDRITHYHCDHLGTPRELTDAQGNVVWSARYKAWGRLLHTEGEIEQPLRFQGQYEDQETGLFYNRYRYYDPDASRYLNRDPAGLSGGMNLYSYAPNPTMWIDPLGLQKKCGTCCLGGRFSSADSAARAALIRYNSKSIRDNLEYGGLIYKGKNGKYDFTKATRGDLDGVDPWSGKKLPRTVKKTGYWHTHGNYSRKRWNTNNKKKMTTSIATIFPLMIKMRKNKRPRKNRVSRICRYSKWSI